MGHIDEIIVFSDGERGCGIDEAGGGDGEVRELHLHSSFPFIWEAVI